MGRPKYASYITAVVLKAISNRWKTVGAIRKSCGLADKTVTRYTRYLYRQGKIQRRKKGVRIYYKKKKRRLW